MLTVHNTVLSKKDVWYVKKYAYWVLKRFVKQSTLRKSHIHLDIVNPEDTEGSEKKEMSSYRAWVVYDGVVNGKRKFSVTLNAERIDRRSKHPLRRLKNLLIDLGHEIIHVKQYLNNEIFEYVNGNVRYKGSYFDSSYSVDTELYFESPWEIEAYGREIGLYRIFEETMRKRGL